MYLRYQTLQFESTNTQFH